MLFLIEVLFLTALQQKRSDQMMTHRDAVLGMLGQYLKGIHTIIIIAFKRTNELTEFIDYQKLGHIWLTKCIHYCELFSLIQSTLLNKQNI